MIVIQDGGLTSIYSGEGTGPMWRVLHQSIQDDTLALPTAYGTELGYHIMKTARGDARLVAQRLLDGTLAWTERLPRIPIDAITTKDHIYVVYPGGQIIPFVAATGAQLSALEGLYGGSLCKDTSGTVYAFRNGYGVVRISDTDRIPVLIAELSGRCDTGPFFLGSSCFVVIREVGLMMIGATSDQFVIPLPTAATGIVSDGSRTLAICLADRSVLIIDTLKRAPWGLVRPRGLMSPSPLFIGQRLFLPGENGAIQMFNLER
jgi:hypothetical protein